VKTKGQGSTIEVALAEALNDAVNELTNAYAKWCNMIEPTLLILE